MEIIITILACFVVFMVLRKVWCWYWKINKIVDELEWQNVKLSKIVELLEQQNKKCETK